MVVRRTRWPSGSRPCRSTVRWILSTSQMLRGTLYPAIRARACSSSVGERPARARAAASTTAATRWPSRSSGTPMTRASNTSGWDFSAPSTSSGKTFSPPVLTQVLPRPSRVIVPSASSRREVAGDRVAHAVDLDEQPRGLLRVLVVAERDVAAAGEPADLARAGRDRLAVLVDDDGVLAGADPRAADALLDVLGDHARCPMKPVSDEPIASVITTFGSSFEVLRLDALGEQRGAGRDRRTARTRRSCRPGTPRSSAGPSRRRSARRR